VAADQAFSIASKELPNNITPDGDGDNDARKADDRSDAADNFFHRNDSKVQGKNGLVKPGKAF
jgi:hypothetical protein